MKMFCFRRAAMLVSGITLCMLAAGCSESPTPKASETEKTAFDSSLPRSYVRGQEREEQGNLFGAIMLYERTVSEHPDFLDGYFALAQAYTLAGKQDSDLYDKAEDVYVRVTGRVGPDDERLMKGQAGLHLARWEIDEAIAIYEGLLADQLESCELWVLLGQAEIAKAVKLRETEGIPSEGAQLEMARQTLQKTMELCPNYIDAYLAMTVILDYDKAYDDIAEMFEGLLDRFPDNVELRRQHTLARFKGRRWEQAAEGFRDLLERDPDPKERLLYISTLRKLDRVEEAEKQMEIYHATAPQEQTAKYLTKLDVLKNRLQTQSDTDRAGRLFEEGKYKEASAIWSEIRERVLPFVHDEEFEHAAKELLLWLDLRLRLAEERMAEQS